MYFDGLLKLKGGRARILYISPNREQLKYVLQILFKVSNNEAKYEALLHGLCLAISLGIKRLLIYSMIRSGTSTKTMDAYVMEICKLENMFSGLEVIRDNNVGAGILLKLGSDRAEVPTGVFVQELSDPIP
jgi:hypothetical protein